MAFTFFFFGFFFLSSFAGFGGGGGGAGASSSTKNCITSGLGCSLSAATRSTGLIDLRSCFCMYRTAPHMQRSRKTSAALLVTKVASLPIPAQDSMWSCAIRLTRQIGSTALAEVRP